MAASKDLYGALKKVCIWLDKLADSAEANAKSTRFETMRVAWEADMKNYRATSNDLKKVIAKAESNRAEEMEKND